MSGTCSILYFYVSFPLLQGTIKEKFPSRSRQQNCGPHVVQTRTEVRAPSTDISLRRVLMALTSTEPITHHSNIMLNIEIKTV